MGYLKLRKINKLYFGYEEISRALGISPRSAMVSANRYVKSGIILRLKRNLYVLKERWDNLEPEERFTLANIIQVPSYISLMTAMEYYGITTQLQQDFVESMSIYRTKEVKIEESIFNYTKIDKKLYFGFTKIKSFFMASPEKAFMDAVYLTSLKRYKFDFSSINFNKLNKEGIKKIIKKTPLKTEKLLKEKWIY